MKHKEQKVRDPVCGMLVNPQQLVVEHMHMPFAFCSEQCRERFLANPGLYVGRPGEKAPKQEGQEVIKCRKIRLVSPLPSGNDKILQNKLCAMMGIKSVIITDDFLEITYDLLQATAKQIEMEIVKLGIQLGEGWDDRLQRAWVHFEEEMVISGMELPSSGGNGGSCH